MFRFYYTSGYFVIDCATENLRVDFHGSGTNGVSLFFIGSQFTRRLILGCIYFVCCVVQGYLYFWRDEGERAPLSPEQATALFGNVDDIYRFNSQFLTQLQSCGLDPVEVARCFVRNNSGFTIYTDYCTNYPR